MLQISNVILHKFNGFRPAIPAAASVLNRNFHMSPVVSSSCPPKLMKQPVPDLHATLNKYVKTLQPLLTEDELKKSIKIIEKFGQKDGIGEKLQMLLCKRWEKKENWLADWWLNAAYLSYRKPVVIHSNPGLVFPKREFKNEKEKIDFTAKLILAAMNYKLSIDRDEIPQEKMGKFPLDMGQYKKVFGTCRIPGIKVDTLEYNPCSKHIIVANNNHFFKVTVLNDDNELIDYKTLVCFLNQILKDSESPAVPVGILTTEQRDRWGQAYVELIKDNKTSVCYITTSLFLVCFDKPLPPMPFINIRTKAGLQCIHGGGSRFNAGNRWYDKTIQFLISPDGINGMTYEHAPAEGQPVAIMTDKIVDDIQKNEFCIDDPPTKCIPCPEHLKFKISSKTLDAITAAKAHSDLEAANLDLCVFAFRGYGKEFIKSQKLSPDSYIQMAFQLTYFRIHKEPTATYESAAARLFLHGRTETIRSCSCESLRFCVAMLDHEVSVEDKVGYLKDAITAHKKYTIEAMKGEGVDRHLLGLKLIALENKIELPEIYKDPAFAKSMNFRITSSQVALKSNSTMVYGPTHFDGYSCCYNPRPMDMLFNIGAFHEYPGTSAKHFASNLEASLKDMHDVLCMTKSKL